MSINDQSLDKARVAVALRPFIQTCKQGHGLRHTIPEEVLSIIPPRTDHLISVVLARHRIVPDGNAYTFDG